MGEPVSKAHEFVGSRFRDTLIASRRGRRILGANEWACLDKAP